MGTSGCGSEIAMSTPGVGEAGATGNWRNQRPVMDVGTCLAVKQGKVTCQICWGYCPDACIRKGVAPTIDLTYCKGCGICAEVCPAGAISMAPEADHGTCATDAASAKTARKEATR